MHTCRRKCWLTGCALLLSMAAVCTAAPGHCLADDGNAELQAVVQGCQNAVAAIKSGFGKFTEHYSLTRNGVVLLETSSECVLAFKGERYRLTRKVTYLQNNAAPPAASVPHLAPIKPGTKIEDEIAFDGSQVTFYQPRKKTASISGTGSRGYAYNEHLKSRSSASLIGHGLFVIDWPNKQAESETLLSEKTRVIGREPVDGDECVIVERSFHLVLSDGKPATRTFLYWVSPAKGFAIPKAQRWFEGGRYGSNTLIREETAELKDYGSGVWGPAVWRMSQYELLADGTKQTRQVTITYAPDFRLNLAMGEDRLSLRLPSGTKVRNETLDLDYTVP